MVLAHLVGRLERLIAYGEETSLDRSRLWALDGRRFMFYSPREPTLSSWFCDGKYNKSKSLFHRGISMSELPCMRQVMDVARTSN